MESHMGASLCGCNYVQMHFSGGNYVWVQYQCYFHTQKMRQKKQRGSFDINSIPLSSFGIRFSFDSQSLHVGAVKQLELWNLDAIPWVESCLGSIPYVCNFGVNWVQFWWVESHWVQFCGSNTVAPCKRQRALTESLFSSEATL